MRMGGLWDRKVLHFIGIMTLVGRLLRIHELSSELAEGVARDVCQPVSSLTAVRWGMDIAAAILFLGNPLCNLVRNNGAVEHTKAVKQAIDDFSDFRKRFNGLQLSIDRTNQKHPVVTLECISRKGVTLRHEGKHFRLAKEEFYQVLTEFLQNREVNFGREDAGPVELTKLCDFLDVEDGWNEALFTAVLEAAEEYVPRKKVSPVKSIPKKAEPIPRVTQMQHFLNSNPHRPLNSIRRNIESIKAKVDHHAENCDPEDKFLLSARSKIASYEERLTKLSNNLAALKGKNELTGEDQQAIDDFWANASAMVGYTKKFLTEETSGLNKFIRHAQNTPDYRK